MANTVPRKSLLQYSMEGGVWLGIYLIVRFACMVMGLYFPVANLLALALFVGTPFVLYRIMMVYHRNNSYISFFSLLWMMGIMLFFFASLICSVAEYIYYQYINPQYIAELFNRAFALIKEMDVLSDTISLEEMSKALAEGSSPTSLQMVMQSIWSNVFFGSLLSMIVAPFVLQKRKKS